MAKRPDPYAHLRARNGKAMSDAVDFWDMDEEIQRLRSAIVLLAQCCGAHIISQQDGKQLMELLKPRHER